MPSFNIRRRFEFLVCCAVWFLSRQLPAEEVNAPKSASLDRVSALVLFERGKKRLLAEDFAEACPLLEESHRLVPGIGVLLQLAVCLEKSKQFAAAWGAFEEAAERARAEGDSAREELARSYSARLRTNLSFLRLRVRVGQTEGKSTIGQTAGLQVTWDGKPMSPALLGIEVPVDSGEHQIVVMADGMQQLSKSFTLAPGEHQELELELLPSPKEPKPALAGVGSVPPVQPQRPSPTPLKRGTSRNSSTRGSSQDWIGWTIAGFGAAGLVAGVTSGVLAYSQMNRARQRCVGRPTNDCPADAIQWQDAARTSASVSTASFAAGLACFVVAGGYWLATASGPTSVTAWLGPNLGMLSVSSRW